MTAYFIKVGPSTNGEWPKQGGNMKKWILGALAVAASLCLVPAVFAGPGHDCPMEKVAQATSPAAAVKAPAECKYCGMNLEKYAFSRVVIEYDDGSSTGLCSIHCAAVDLANNLDKGPKAIKVGDYGTRQLIDAETAAWVIGGSKQGVMTRQAKWAFAKKDDAEKFIKENGGRTATFDEVMKAAYDDMYQDTRMIREKRKMKRMQMEKK
jgi:nitrous oxide reductase accessory protein NosL